LISVVGIESAYCGRGGAQRSIINFDLHARACGRDEDFA